MVDNLETALYYIDWKSVVIAIAVASLLTIAGTETWKKIKEIFGIEFKKDREKREAYELLLATNALANKTAENLDKLQNRHTNDEEIFRNNLNTYIEESRKDRKALHDEMTQYSENRVSDRQQSIAIQKELKDSIASREIQIESLVIANKEMLAEKINEKYKYYIGINGIPEDEYDEFVSLHSAYKGLGGNHHGDAKFQYCMDHLPIIPVETKIINK